MDSSITHEMEDRLRNIEAHLGIGKVDEETGDYSVDQHSSRLPDDESKVETKPDDEHPEE